ncbi:hypothetical protein OUO20_00090 [Arthrobacter sp. FX8]|uniref:hypothetical protein n=1 Tax=Arthrobacter sp. FX8 TaxID=2997335 RepID=UPI00227AF19F|nr:hypothetical protein [Arthrobacter sp. FX8]WAJ35430.1 hypothetical protein OUO20_00090 [Arthrobacter sp. FX8]
MHQDPCFPARLRGVFEFIRGTYRHQAVHDGHCVPVVCLRFPCSEEGAQPASFLGAGVRPVALHGNHLHLRAPFLQARNQARVVDVAA